MTTSPPYEPVPQLVHPWFPLLCEAGFDKLCSDRKEDTIVTISAPFSDSNRKRAENALNRGLESLERGDEEKARRYFSQSIEIDSTYADGHNRLADIAMRQGKRRRARSLYRKAKELAEADIKDIPEGQFWAVVPSRPYMRALYGLGIVSWQQDKNEQALSVFKHMLKLDPDDNQRVRYFMGPIYHKLGDLKEAAKWYRRNEDDALNLFNYGWILIRQAKLERAARILVCAIFANPYIAPMLLRETLPKKHWLHRADPAESQYADDYTAEFGGLWAERDFPIVFLESICYCAEVQQNLEEFVAKRRALKKAKTEEQRVRLRMAADALCSPETVKKMTRMALASFERDLADAANPT